MGCEQNPDHEYVNHLDSEANSLQVWDAMGQVLVDRRRISAVLPTFAAGPVDGW
jgi:hypothetical protein